MSGMQEGQFWPAARRILTAVSQVVAVVCSRHVKWPGEGKNACKDLKDGFGGDQTVMVTEKNPLFFDHTTASTVTSWSKYFIAHKSIQYFNQQGVNMNSMSEVLRTFYKSNFNAFK